MGFHKPCGITEKRNTDSANCRCNVITKYIILRNIRDKESLGFFDPSTASGPPLFTQGRLEIPYVMLNVSEASPGLISLPSAVILC